MCRKYNYMSKTNDAVQIFYQHNGVIRAAEPVQPATAKSNPIKQVVDAMKKVDLKSPEAKLNEVSIKDKNGNRIKLDDEPVRTTYFRGVEPSGNYFRGVEEDKKK